MEKEKSLNSQIKLKREGEDVLLLLTEELTDSRSGTAERLVSDFCGGRNSTDDKCGTTVNGGKSRFFSRSIGKASSLKEKNRTRSLLNNAHDGSV